MNLTIKDNLQKNNKVFKNSILMKTKIKLIFTVTVFIILLGVILSCFLYSRSFITDMLLHNYREIATKQFEFIEYWTERSVENTEKIAFAPDVRNYLFKRYAGMPVSAREATALKHYLEKIKFDHEVYIRISVVDTDGKICGSSDNHAGSISGSPLFNEIKDTDDIHIPSACIDNSEGRHRICQPVSYPVYQYRGEKGNITGYVITYVNLDILDDSISMINLGKTGKAYIIDKQGRVVCSSTDIEKNKSGKLNTMLLNPNTKKDVEGISRCLKTARAGNGEYISSSGENVFGVWKWYSYFEWIFLVEVDRKEALAPVAMLTKILLLIGFVFIIATAGLAFYLSKLIINPVESLNNRMKEISAGDADLTQELEISSNDEYGEMADYFNRIIKGIKEIIINIKYKVNQLEIQADDMHERADAFSMNSQNQASSAEEITASMEELNTVMENINNRTDQQFTNLESLSSKMEELSDIIQNVSERINSAAKETFVINELAIAGDQNLKQLTGLAVQIDTGSKEMKKIVEIINDISDRINLLALNAAIEAARAGDSGRGFMVVADEISTLAEQTASSIKGISDLINTNNMVVNSGFGDFANTMKTLKDIIKGVGSVSGTLESIAEYIKVELELNSTVNQNASEVKIQSEQIKTAINEQKNASTEISKSLSNISDSTQLSATGSEEMADASKKVSEISQSIKSTVGIFRI